MLVNRQRSSPDAIVLHSQAEHSLTAFGCRDHHLDRPWHNETPAQKASKFCCEPMPLEASGDVLIYTALAAAAGNDTTLAELYLPRLRTFAEYVAQNGRDPVLQLYTDDYLGPSALNANLAAKSTIALAAYARLCAQLGLQAEGEHYAALARSWAAYWRTKAAGEHNRL